MQIVYCYVETDINIRDQGINFGSQYIYTTDLVENQYQIKRENNSAYVGELFRRNSGGLIDNVTAIVGQNGSGKTNLMQFLINALEGNPFITNGFLILSDGGKNFKIINCTTKKINADFKISTSPQIAEYSGLYYNPIYDFQDHYREVGSQIIDVSSNTLMHYDYYDDQFFSESLNMVDLHKFKNISRQVRFMVTQKNARKIRDYIDIPRRIDVAFIDPKFTHDKQGIDNISYDFRPFYELGVNIWRKRKSAIRERQHELQESNKRKRFNQKDDNDLVYIGILFHLWKFIFYTQEINNSTLEEGHLNSYTEDDFAELGKLSFEEYIKAFLRDQNNIFDADSIINFIDVVKNIALKSKNVNEDSNGFVMIDCNLNQVELILDAYDPMIEKLSSLLHGRQPNGLLQFNWRNMSSGEKAFLDLFARVSHGMGIIDRKVKKNPNFKTPEYLYLLIDEGEIGFHLQWQKEYVSILLDILPRIINLKNVKNKLHIQLIFTTHSPISLSDIPRYNTVYLKRDEEGMLNVILEKDSPKYSFGANIHEIMYDAFYLKNGFTGNFSKEIIDEIFAWANNKDKHRLSASYVRKLINLIDDPILRIKLEESYAQKVGINMERSVLEAKIEIMGKRLREIQKQQNDQN